MAYDGLFGTPAFVPPQAVALGAEQSAQFVFLLPDGLVHDVCPVDETRGRLNFRRPRNGYSAFQRACDSRMTALASSMSPQCSTLVVPGFFRSL